MKEETQAWESSVPFLQSGNMNYNPGTGLKWWTRVTQLIFWIDNRAKDISLEIQRLFHQPLCCSKGWWTYLLTTGNLRGFWLTFLRTWVCAGFFFGDMLNPNWENGPLSHFSSKQQISTLTAHWNHPGVWKMLVCRPLFSFHFFPSPTILFVKSSPGISNTWPGLRIRPRMLPIAVEVDTWWLNNSPRGWIVDSWSQWYISICTVFSQELFQDWSS